MIILQYIMFTLWFTGLSGSGKSTIANELKKVYPEMVLLDGDIIRRGLNNDLGFSREDRQENLRRLAEVCNLFNKNGKDVITAFISPLEESRQFALNTIKNCFIIYCNSSLETCEERDVKGLYKKARSGEIPEFTGISSPFEEPEDIDYMLDTENYTIQECVDEVIDFIEQLRMSNEILGFLR